MEPGKTQVIKVAGRTIDVDTRGQERITYYDRAGKPFLLQIHEGVHYNCFLEVPKMNKIKDFELRPDDIYMPGYMRTGTHWAFEMISMMLKQRAETVAFWKGHSQIEMSPPGVLESLPSPRLVFCHRNLYFAPRSLKDLKCKIIFNQRDPRDVALSLYKMNCDATSITGYTGEFKDFLYLFLEGKVPYNGILEQALECEKFLDENPDIPVYVFWYEDALRDTVATLRELSDFLELPRNDELFKAIAKKCEFNQMAKDKEHYTLTVDGKRVIYGHGVSGRWREHFTDEMLEDYYRVYEEKMAGSRFYRKEYARPCPKATVVKVQDEIEPDKTQVFKVAGRTIDVDTRGQELITYYDRAGKPYLLQIHEGVHYNCFNQVPQMNRVKDFELRLDDIYMPGYMRTGTHWAFEMISMLLKQKAETVPFWKGLSQIENSPPGVLESLPSPRLVFCHRNLYFAPRSLKDLKCKIIFNQRDPRDVALSLYKMSHDATSITGYTGEFKDFLYLFLEGKVDCNGVLEQALECEKFLDENPDIPVYVFWYEDALRDTDATLRELSDFLELPRNDELFKAIAEKCEFNQMVKDKKNYTITLDGNGVIYGQGVSGRWREHFTDEMLEDYYRVYEEKMAGSRFYRKEYARPCPSEKEACLR